MTKFPFLTVYRNIYLIIGRLIILIGFVLATVVFFTSLFLPDVILSSLPAQNFNVNFYLGWERLGIALLSFGGIMLFHLVISGIFLIVSEIIFLFLRIEDHLEKTLNFNQQFAALQNPDLAWDFDIPIPSQQKPWLIARMSSAVFKWSFNRLPVQARELLLGDVENMDQKEIDEALRKEMRGSKIDSPTDNNNLTPSGENQPADSETELENDTHTTPLEPDSPVVLRVVVTVDNAGFHETPDGKVVRSTSKGRAGKIDARTANGRWYKVADSTYWIAAENVRVKDGDPTMLMVI